MSTATARNILRHFWSDISTVGIGISEAYLNETVTKHSYVGSNFRYGVGKLGSLGFVVEFYRRFEFHQGNIVPVQVVCVELLVRNDLRHVGTLACSTGEVGSNKYAELFRA